MPYKEHVFGPKWGVRLRDLTATDCLRMTCFLCGYKLRCAPHVLHDRFPDYKPIVDIERLFKCPSCGVRGQMLWRVERAHFDG